MTKALIVLEKEWLEVRLQRSLMLTTFLLPPAITLFAVGVFYAAGAFPGSGNMSMPPGVKLDPALAGMSLPELGQTVIGKQFSIMFMLLPVFIPSVIASYAVVGEKRDRTLEPLLATPVETWQLLSGKTLAALVPTLLVTLVCGALFALGIVAFALSPQVTAAIVTPGWWLVLVLDAPLLALIGIALIVIVSSRANDPRSAQQISAVLIVPVMLLLFGNLTGVLFLSPVVAVVAAVFLAALAILTVRIAARLFQREAILTRWK